MAFLFIFLFVATVVPCFGYRILQSGDVPSETYDFIIVGGGTAVRLLPILFLSTDLTL